MSINKEGIFVAKETDGQLSYIRVCCFLAGLLRSRGLSTLELSGALNLIKNVESDPNVPITEIKTDDCEGEWRLAEHLLKCLVKDNPAPSTQSEQLQHQLGQATATIQDAVQHLQRFLADPTDPEGLVYSLGQRLEELLVLTGRSLCHDCSLAVGKPPGCLQGTEKTVCSYYKCK